MAKKIVLDPADFEKLIQYIIEQPVRFNQAAKAVEIQEIFKNALHMEIEFKEPVKK